MITAKIICDSINPAGVRLTTFELTYPRFIHSEFMTHRAISRNAASSRAIPIEKMMEAVEKEPARPEYWGSKKAGMQSGEALVGFDLKHAKQEWEIAAEGALESVRYLNNVGLHKSLANRLLEPFSHITVIAT